MLLLSEYHSIKKHKTTILQICEIVDVNIYIYI